MHKKEVKISKMLCFLCVRAILRLSSGYYAVNKEEDTKMRKSLFKKATAVFCALALTMSTATTCFAWEDYFGQNRGWYEGALGELTSQSATGWTAALELIGWGGVWGAQVKDETLSIEAGVEYNLSFDVTSTDIDKWIVVKISDDSAEQPVLWGTWVHCTPGQKQHVEKTVKLDAPGTKIVFGIGGDFGDRVDEEELYALSSETPKDADGDPLLTTTIKLENYSFAPAAAEENLPEGDDVSVDDSEDKGTSAGSTSTGSTGSTGSTTTTTSTTVKTGDFTPIACATGAVVAAAAIVVFTRKREDA